MEKDQCETRSTDSHLDMLIPTLRAKALVVFPGGYGTFDELFETLTLIQTRTITPLPIVLVGEDYWRKALNFDFLVDAGVIDPEDRELFWYAESAEGIWRDILNWYASIGEPLIAPNEEKIRAINAMMTKFEGFNQH